MFDPMTEDSPTPSSQVSASKMDSCLAAALARGKIVKERLAADEGGSISSMEVARLLGIARTTVLRRWHAHRLVAWKRERAVRFPLWQFEGTKLLRGIEEILKTFQSNDQWRVITYFLSKRLSLGGRRPLDLLREGKATEVVAHAKAYAADNTW